jgi:hypothetical protein
MLTTPLRLLSSKQKSDVMNPEFLQKPWPQKKPYAFSTAEIALKQTEICFSDSRNTAEILSEK